MSNTILRDKKKRVCVKQNEINRINYKSIIRDLSIPPEIRLFCQSKRNKLNRNGSPVRTRNRCTITGRGRGVFSFYKLSRILLRQLGSQGLLVGVVKRSW